MSAATRNVSPVAGSVTSTCAPGTDAPCWSLTTPSRRALVGTWENPAIVLARESRTHVINERIKTPSYRLIAVSHDISGYE
jgi:hypothetical protein